MAAKEEAALEQPPPEKRQKLVAEQTEDEDEDDGDEDEDYGDLKEGLPFEGEESEGSGDGDDGYEKRRKNGPLRGMSEEKVKALLAEMKALDDKLDKEILIYSAPFEALDVSGAILMPVDLHGLHRRGFDLREFRRFLFECRDARILQLYDHPGDPRPGGFCHQRGEDVDEDIIDCAHFVVDCYNQLPQTANKLHLKEVVSVTIQSSSDPYYYITFRAVDELSNQEKTYQAHVLEADSDVWFLGMLRDASAQKVLAVLEEVPTEKLDAVMNALGVSYSRAG